MNVQTIQERLEALADRDADVKVSALIESLPYIDHLIVRGVAVGGDTTHEVKVQSYHLLHELRKEFKKIFYAAALQERTDRLMNAVDEIETIKSAIEG